MKSAETLGGRFATTVAQHGDRRALWIGRRRFSYRELAAELNLRRAELTAGQPPARPIAVVIDGSESRILSMLAVLFSSHPLIPIDSGSPHARIAAIAREAGAVVVSDDVFETGQPGATDVCELPDCAVLAFTSGSTGAPKAVRQGHELWLNQADELVAELGIGPGDVVAQALPLGFGGGLDITVTTLLGGAELQVLDARLTGVSALVSELTERVPDSLHLSPALLRAVLAESEGLDLRAALASVAVVATCGEALDAADVARLRDVAPQITFVNRSGSSEAGNLAFGIYPPSRELPVGTLPAGKPARDKTFRFLADDGSAVSATVGGIIEVTSAVIARGYLVGGRAVDFPEIEPGVRRLRLDDRATLINDELVLRGRADDTVKIRGYRVDIAEVTAAARAVTGIADAVAVVQTGAAGPELVVYLSPPRGSRPPAIAEVRTQMAAALPAWMLPTHHILLSELPRTVRGKVDRTALPRPPARPDFTPPTTETEQILAALWGDLLAVTEVGCDDDFLALGGDSLTAVTLLSRIDESFGVTLSASAPFVHSALRSLAAAIDEAAPRRSTAALVELSIHSGEPDSVELRSRPVLFAIAGAGESALAFAPLARRLPQFRVIGIHAHGLEARGIPDWTIAAAARRTVRLIREVAPTGPYRFVGHSLGGIIAMESARHLEADGETVEHLVCVDTILSGPLQRRSTVALPVDGEAATAELGDPAPEEEATGTTSRRALWRMRLALLSAGWWPRPTRAQWALFHELGRRSAMLHRLRPWTGPLTVITAEDNPDPRAWWGLLAPGCQGVHPCPGDHNGILRPPHVEQTAEVVRRALAGVSV